ncbi:uncharacterized protein I303_100648 [Kwoniella dejecticola CBS 10117]|uniref:Major facilitator superfamily (MFS) profile domain-containing protein n=1 Tax=Kwoniella dejecticola CBS 10117 TaxID=1296121 RepID=A0A1A6AFI8_9TREE|nr:uncharacterized protein I303_00652 [Kwoniella dejecticola CBS 10117]OBR88835.1 hypothetical protein I303_00652 [Kwoniella dejecticola CBS 10117]
MPLVQRTPSPLPRPINDDQPAVQLEQIRIPTPGQNHLSPTSASSTPIRSKHRTPVPYLKILPLLTQRCSEGLTYAIVFPYINQMVLDMGVEEKSVGVWSAIAESTMMATEAMSAPIYGPLADKYGRRPVMICLNAMWGVFGIAFGLSKTVYTAIMFRAALGLLAGCGVISRTMVGELCDKSNRVQGFAVFSPSIVVGMTLAPVLGGFLANPAGRIVPSSWSLFVDYPYLLPSIVTGLSAIIAGILSIILLPETLQRSKGDTSQRDLEKSSNSGLKGLLKYEPFQNVLLLYGMNNAVMFSWEAIYPLFGFTSKNLGGLGLSTQTLGLVLGFSAGLSILMTIFVFPLLHSKLSEAACLRLCLISYPCAIVFFPILWALSYPSSGDRLPICVWVIMSVQMILRRVGDFATTQLDALILDSIPGPEHLASANAITFSVAALGRAIGPFIISWFFSLSTRFASPFSPGRHLVWIIFIIICIPPLYFANRLLNDINNTLGKEEVNHEEERYELMGNHHAQLDVPRHDHVEARGTSIEVTNDELVRYRVV